MLGLGTAIVTSGTVLDSALLDDFGGAAVGYSVRRLNGDYYGPCMRVRRDSDNAERDIYFGVDDVLDTSTLEDFCDGTDGYVVRWYNQTESYESLKLLNQSYASSPEAAYSVRQLDNSYDGPCMEVASSDDVIGFRMTADQDASGNIGLRYNDTSAYSGGATVFTGEVYVDAPSHITASKNVRFRLQMTKSGGGAALSNYVVVQPSKQKKWIKATWTLNAVPVENGLLFVQDRNNGTDFLKGEQMLFRNIEATGYTAVYDEDDYDILNFGDETEVTKGYNIPFTADGDLDEAKIVEHGYASPFECLEIDVADTTDATGNYQIVIPGADTITGDPSASGTYTVTTEIYVDCPSISGAVSFKGQIGTSTKNFTEGNTVAQKQWVTRTMSGTVASEGQESARIYFAGTGQVAQELDEGDKIYFRRITLNHSEDSTYNAEYDFTSSDEGVTYSFPSGGNGDATLSHGKAPAEELNVTKWYDQSGNGNDATQTTFANTPQVYQYNSTTKDYRVVKENDRSAIEFESGELLGFDNTDTYDELSVFVAAIKPTTQANSPFVSKLGNGAGSGTKKGDFHLRSQSAFIRTIAGNTDGSQYVYTEPDTHSVFSFLWDGSVQSAVDSPLGDGEAVVRIDSTIVDQTAQDGNFNGGTDQFRINATHTVATDLGRYQEVMVFSEYLPNGRQSIEENIDAHFRITNDLDATQSDDAKQPQVVDNGSTVTESDIPIVDFYDGDSLISLDANFDELYGQSNFNAYVASTTSDTIHLMFYGSGDDYSFAAKDGETSANLSLDFGTSAELRVNGLVKDTGSGITRDDVYDYLDGKTIKLERGSTSNWTSFQMMDYSGGNYAYEGKVYEMVFYNTDTSSSDVGIEDNMNDFYSIYDKSSYRLLDYYSGAAAAFSLRKLLSTYTGDAIEVRRTSDNTTQDIGFTANGDLDTAALATFCGSYDGFVTKWYDQSGNSNDAVQTTPGFQPKIYDGDDGVLTENGRNKIRFDGTDDFLATGYDVSGTDYAAFYVQTPVSGVAGQVVGRGDGSSRHVFGWNGGDYAFFYRAGTTAIQAGDTPQQYLGSIKNESSSSSCEIRYNGQLGTSSSTIGTGALVDMVIGAERSSLSAYGESDVFEVVIYDSDQSDNRVAIQDDINNYYSVYEKTKLLDLHPDAAAAYSLRKLMGYYSGSAIEVRRDSDNTTQDIGFDANGNLDTAALAAFCGSSNGFVETWYDQSVNGNDATQTTPANQPKIYDATTGVIKDNGKPATEWSGAANQLLDTSYTTDSSEFTVVAVANADDNATNKTIVLAPEALVFVANDESARHIQGDAAQTPYSPAGSTDQMLHFVGNSGSESFAGDNGTALTTRSESPATNSKLRIGANANGSINFLGTIQEIVYYASDQSGSRSDIEANVNRYYSIY